MLVCDNCGKVAEQNHCKTEVSSMRDCKGFEAKLTYAKIVLTVLMQNY